MADQIRLGKIRDFNDGIRHKDRKKLMENDEFEAELSSIYSSEANLSNCSFQTSFSCSETLLFFLSILLREDNP